MDVFSIKDELDVLVVELDVERMPPNIRAQYMQDIKNTIKEVFPKNKILVIPSRAKLNIVKKEI